MSTPPPHEGFWRVKGSDLHRLGRLLSLCWRRVRRKARRPAFEGAETEREQAVVRVVLGGTIILYMWSTVAGAALPAVTSNIAWFTGLFLIGATSLLIAVWRGSAPSRTRRYFGIGLDISATTVAIALAGEAGSPLLGVYLWVIVGNGFRYGPHYLAVASGVSLIGFGFVAIYADYWREHPFLSVSYLLVLLLIPAYVAILLTKLRAAIQQANEASLAKSQFLAKMSHELRTPLNGVIGMSDLLMDCSLERQEKEFVRTIHNSGKTLLGIIDNILDFSRIEAGRLPVEEVDFDLHRLVAETVAMFAPQAERKQIALTHRFDPRVPFSLHGDALHIRQILMNLLGNAMKFTEEGVVDVRVRLADSQHEEDRFRIRFEVEDTGIGIAAEDQQRIFESFRQANSSDVRRIGGTGLGTAIARELTHLMDGRIGLRSELGSGSMFWVELPLGIVERDASDRERMLVGETALVLGNDHAAWAVRDRLTGMGLLADLETLPEAINERLEQARSLGRPYGHLFVLERDLNAYSGAFRGAPDEASDVTLRFLLMQKAPGERFAALSPGFHGALGLPLRRNELENAVHAVRSLRALPENVVSLAEYYRRLAPAESKQLHVLVAEDNETNRQVLRAILERAGHRLTVVEDGDAALDLLQQRVDDFDLLVLDKNMPGRSGLDVFRALRFMNPRARIPTIILSADATSWAMDECRDAGIDAYLTKPVESRRLLETIARLGRGAEVEDVSPRSVSSANNRAALDASLVDHEKLESLRRLGEDGSFFEDLVNGFQRDAERSVLEIAEALASSDYPALRAAVHALEGSASEVGAVGLSEAAGRFRSLKPFELESAKARELLEVLQGGFATALERIKASDSGARGDQVQ